MRPAPEQSLRVQAAPGCESRAMPESIAPRELGLPPAPDPELDVYLDAAARCFTRYGLRRARVTDIADAVGVSRVTVYRQVGNIDQIARLLLSRELDRLVTSLIPKALSASQPSDVIDVIAKVVDYALEHPVMQKVLSDESDLVGSFAATELNVLIERLVSLAEPLLRRVGPTTTAVDPRTLADWIARIGITMVLAPPALPTRTFLSEVVLPLLSMGADDDQRAKRRRASGARQ